RKKPVEHASAQLVFYRAASVVLSRPFAQLVLKGNFQLSRPMHRQMSPCQFDGGVRCHSRFSGMLRTTPGRVFKLALRGGGTKGGAAHKAVATPNEDQGISPVATTVWFDLDKLELLAAPISDHAEGKFRAECCAVH